MSQLLRKAEMGAFSFSLSLWISLSFFLSFSLFFSLFLFSFSCLYATFSSRKKRRLPVRSSCSWTWHSCDHASSLLLSLSVFSISLSIFFSVFLYYLFLCLSSSLSFYRISFCAYFSSLSFLSFGSWLLLLFIHLFLNTSVKLEFVSETLASMCVFSLCLCVLIILCFSLLLYKCSILLFLVCMPFLLFVSPTLFISVFLSLSFCLCLSLYVSLSHFPSVFSFSFLLSLSHSFSLTLSLSLFPPIPLVTRKAVFVKATKTEGGVSARLPESGCGGWGGGVSSKKQKKNWRMRWVAQTWDEGRPAKKQTDRQTDRQRQRVILQHLGWEFKHLLFIIHLFCSTCFCFCFAFAFSKASADFDSQAATRISNV